MDKYTIIKLKEAGKSNRAIASETGINRKTIARYWNEYQDELAKLSSCTDSETDIRDIQNQIVSGRRYNSSARRPTKYTPDVDALLDQILKEEDEKNKILGNHKQQLTHEQIHKRITDSGYDIGRTTLSAYIKQKRDKIKETFVRQEYEPGDRLEYDFGDVKLVIGGVAGTYHLAVLASPGGHDLWAYVYDNMRKEVFMDSHVRYFEKIGGCQKEVVYDNMKNVVTRFIGKNEKELNPDLVKMSLYYGFKINVTNCFSGNEKGYVESSVKKLQREVFAERYIFDTLEDAEAYLHERLLEINKDSLMEEEKQHLLEYRPPLELGYLTNQKVNKYSFIQVENNYYSVPEHLVGHWVKAKVYLREILIYTDSRLVASHKKIDGYHQAQVDIFHYLETLEKKPGALRNSKALKSKTELKAIYEQYFTSRTKEFIALLRENANKTYPQLLDLLKEKGRSPGKALLEEVNDDSVTSNTRKQLSQITLLYRNGGSGHVN